jgi:phytoene synthase
MAESGFETREAQAKASGSSFYAGMRLLPQAERDAMFAIYAFSRAVDDIADEGNDTRDARRAALDEWRDDIASLYTGTPRERAAFLKEAVDRYGLKQEDFRAIIDGMEMDVLEDIRAPDLAKLDLYCDRVASAVGRLSVKVFGMDEEPGVTLSHHLGRALQLTNILRDLDADAAVGRLYLPRELLAESGFEVFDPGAVIANPKVDAACRIVARIAHEHYRRADDVMRARPKGLLRAPPLMGAVYSEILKKTEHAGWAPPRARARIGRLKMLMILTCYGFR